MTFERDESEIYQNWSYLIRKKVSVHGASVSDDLAYILDKNGKPIAKNITKSYGGRSRVGLFWYGWMTQLERIQDIILRLSQQSVKTWDEGLEPLIYKHMGDNKELMVWGASSKNERNFAWVFSREKTNRWFRVKNSERNKEVLSWTTRSASTPLSPAQLPRPTPLGEEISRLMKRRDEIQRRLNIARFYFNEAIHGRLKTIADDYSPGDVIRFMIGKASYTYMRSQYDSGASSGWERIGNFSEIDFSSISLKESFCHDTWRWESLVPLPHKAKKRKAKE